MIYQTDDLSDFHSVVELAVKELKPHTRKFDSIAARGVSGIAIAAPVAFLLKKPLVVVRKDTEMRHSSRVVEGIKDIGSRYVFLDDFISGGTTLREVITAIRDNGGPREPRGIYLYDGIRGYGTPEKVRIEFNPNYNDWIYNWPDL